MIHAASRLLALSLSAPLLLLALPAGCGSTSTSDPDDELPPDAGLDAGSAIDGDDAGPCPDGCFIDGACFANGDTDPERPCFGCNTTITRSRFTPLTGTACDDGAFCTVGDVCESGRCVGGGTRDCDDGIDCNGGEGCDVSADECAPLGGSPCIGDEMCDVELDECVVDCPDGCAIGTTCIPADTVDPENQCQICDPSRDGLDWSPADGRPCTDGANCTEDDVCTGGECIGTPVLCDDGIDCNGVEACDETTGGCEDGATTCVDGEVCDEDADACVCDVGFTDCSGACVDLDTDPDYCGDCMTSCAAGSGCSGGMCTEDLTPGSSAEVTRRGWSVRCQAWSGDLCTHVQVKVSCGTCSTYSDCDDWHDLNPHNSASTRAAPVFCEIATGDSGVARTSTSGTSSSPRACGWNSSTHPLCEASRATLAVTGATGLVGGLLANDGYCGTATNLLEVECDGW